MAHIGVRRTKSQNLVDQSNQLLRRSVDSLTNVAVLTLPLSAQFTEMGASAPAYYETLAHPFYKGNFYTYQIGMAILGIGGLALTYTLIQSRLVPRPLAIWGFVGYIIHATGAVLELFGLPYAVYFIIPGGLFEIALSL